MLTDRDDILLLDDDDVCAGPQLSLVSNNPELLQRFVDACYAALPKSLGWFHQGNSAQWKMFEFWRPDTQIMRGVAEQIAEDLGLPLTIRLRQEYPLR